MQADVAMVVAKAVANAAISVNKFFFNETPSFQSRIYYVNFIYIQFN